MYPIKKPRGDAMLPNSFPCRCYNLAGGAPDHTSLHQNFVRPSIRPSVRDHNNNSSSSSGSSGSKPFFVIRDAARRHAGHRAEPFRETHRPSSDR